MWAVLELMYFPWPGADGGGGGGGELTPPDFPIYLVSGGKGGGG